MKFTKENVSKLDIQVLNNLIKQAVKEFDSEEERMKILDNKAYILFGFISAISLLLSTNIAGKINLSNICVNLKGVVLIVLVIIFYVLVLISILIFIKIYNVKLYSDIDFKKYIESGDETENENLINEKDLAVNIIFSLESIVRDNNSINNNKADLISYLLTTYLSELFLLIIIAIICIL